MRKFVRNSIKSGRGNAFIQHFIFQISDGVLNIISKKLNVNGIICGLLEKYFEFLNEYGKLYPKEFDSKYDDYRDIDQKGKTG